MLRDRGMSLPTRLRFARVKRGLSQRALTALAGLSPAYVSQIESGVRQNPSLPNVERLALALGVPAAWLAFGLGRFPKGRSLPPLAKPKAERKRAA